MPLTLSYYMGLTEGLNVVVAFTVIVSTSFQGSLSCVEKEPWLRRWLRLVTWKCLSINCAAGIGPPLNFVDWMMKYYLG